MIDLELFAKRIRQIHDALPRGDKSQLKYDGRAIIVIMEATDDLPVERIEKLIKAGLVRIAPHDESQVPGDQHPVLWLEFSPDLVEPQKKKGKVSRS